MGVCSYHSDSRIFPNRQNNEISNTHVSTHSFSVEKPKSARSIPFTLCCVRVRAIQFSSKPTGFCCMSDAMAAMFRKKKKKKVIFAPNFAIKTNRFYSFTFINIRLGKCHALDSVYLYGRQFASPCFFLHYFPSDRPPQRCVFFKF